MRGFVLACVLLFLAHQVSQKALDYDWGWLDDYLDPLLCMPILLYGFDWERRVLWQRPPAPVWLVLGLTAVLALVFEYGFPYWSEAFTGDGWDVVAYFVGAGAYLAFRSYQ